MTDEFIYGNNPKYTIVRKRRIETVGDFEVRIEMKNGEIKGMVMLGDYFIVGDIDDTILRPLKGVRLEREALEKALPEQLDTAILNLRKADFIDLLL